MKLLLRRIWFWIYTVPRFIVILVTVIYKRSSSIYYWVGERIYADQELANDIYDLISDKLLSTKNSNRIIVRCVLKMIDSKKESTEK